MVKLTSWGIEPGPTTQKCHLLPTIPPPPFKMGNLINSSGDTCNVLTVPCDTKESTPDTASIALLTLRILVSVLTIICNLMLVIVLSHLKSPHLKPSTKNLLINAAASQLWLGFGLSLRHLLGGIYIFVFGIYSGALVINGLFLFALDTFITIKKPYSYKLILTSRNSKLALFLTGSFWTGLTLLVLAPLVSYLIRAQRRSSFEGVAYFQPGARIACCTTILVVLLLTIVLSIWIILLLRRISSKIGVAPRNQYDAASINQSNAVELFQISDPSHQARLPTQARKPTLITRQRRLVTILSVSLLITSLCWTQLLIFGILISVYDIHAMDNSKLKAFRAISVHMINVDGLAYPIVFVLLSKEIRSAAKAFWCKC